MKRRPPPPQQQHSPSPRKRMNLSPPKSETHKTKTEDSSFNEEEEEEEEPKIELCKNELGLTVFRTGKSNLGATIKICTGSIVNFRGDCIVNAANSEGVTGGGVDGAINQAGGSKLIQARKSLPFVSGSTTIRILPGSAVVTLGYGTLKCQYVIHCVSADYREVNSNNYEKEDGIVHSAYKSALQIANDRNCKHIAFSLLSAGVYRGERELEQVLQIGLESIKNFAKQDQIVYLVAFTKEERNTLETLFLKHFDPGRSVL